MWVIPQLIFLGIDWVSFGIDFLSFYGIYLGISLALNLEFGYAGIPNFGKVLFVAGGAAFAGSISGRLAQYVFAIRGDFIIQNTSIINTIDTKLVNDPVFVAELILVSLVIAASVGAMFGFLASYPAIRLREDYLGMLLLGSAQFFQVVMRTYEPLVGGAQNINVPDPYFYWSTLPTGTGAGDRTLVAALVAGLFGLVVFMFAQRLGKSPLGRTLRAIRDNEDAARALGKDDAAMRRNILIIASAISGVAGILITFQIASVEWDYWSRFAWTFWPFLIVIIGGSGNNFGTAVGAFFFTLAYKGLQVLQPHVAGFLPFDPNWLQDLAFAAVLIMILLLRPDGLIREKPTPTLPRGKLVQLVAAMKAPAPNQTDGSKGKGFFRRLVGRVWPRKEKSEDPGPPPKSNR
ncbi:MAG TPA: branched-chain amino acid ABC transporter permease [Nitrososphaerales archaeon]|nr:branched-chain amino acid ABC transporter permease [Nitrososphaerales archaeon]